MAKIEFGFHELTRFIDKLSDLGKDIEEICGTVLYAGADVLADEIRTGIDTLPSRTGITKAGLQDGFGIAPMLNNKGVYDVKLGWSGYNANHVPNVLMARIFESGTSIVQKRPFVRPAVNRARKKVLKAMEIAAEKAIEKITR